MMTGFFLRDNPKQFPPTYLRRTTNLTNMQRHIRQGALACALGLALASCQKSMETDSPASETAATRAERASSKGTLFYALTTSNELVRYRSGNPLQELGSMAITGLASGEQLLAIDFRPATGQLYGVSSASKLYTIDLATATASAVGSGFTPAILGSDVGFDFNPTVDRIRLVTNTGQNLRLNPITGAVAAVDGNLNPAGASVSGAGYTNSFAGATTTTLYDIDVASDRLLIQNPPNAGTLVPVGSLGIQALGESGFDIAPDNSVAIAALYGRGLEDGAMAESNGNKYRFYYIDLATGAARNAGKTDRMIRGLAIAPVQ
jgi:hypothetical protein